MLAQADFELAKIQADAQEMQKKKKRKGEQMRSEWQRHRNRRKKRADEIQIKMPKIQAAKDQVKI